MKFEITDPTPLMQEIIEAHRAAPWIPTLDAPEIINYQLTPELNWVSHADEAGDAPKEDANVLTVSVWTKPVMMAAEGVGLQAIRYKSGDTEFYYVPEFCAFMVAVQD